MNNKKNGIPKLRFPGFTGAWEQRKLGEVATFINGRAYKQNELLDSGKYKVLRVGNFYTNDSWYYSNLELADKYYIDEGDLVYTWSATFGPHIWNGEKVIYHYHIWKIELSKFLDRDFTLQILEADKAKLLANTNGSTMIHVTKKDMESKVISLPNIEEQKKIGSYLMKFDSLITLHQRKLEHLQEQKKGLLQKMFPKNGEVVPEVRFPGFTDAWEQRKLGEVATFINGRAYKQNELLDSGKYKVLRVGNFYTNDSWYYSNLELADKYYIDEGDLVYTWSATFGPHIWNGEKVIYHYHIWKIELSKFLDRDFTLQILEADKAKLLANTNGSTMIHVTKKDMESKVISLPNIEEQKKIGSYLMKFDSLITLHQRKLEHLELMKKGLLQQMFV